MDTELCIVWSEDHAGNILTAERKNSRLAAKRAYKKIDRADSDNVGGYGWSIAEDAEPRVRVAVGLKPFLALGERD